MSKLIKNLSGKNTPSISGSLYHQKYITIWDQFQEIITTKITSCITKKIFQKMEVRTCVAAGNSQEQLSRFHSCRRTDWRPCCFNKQTNFWGRKTTTYIGLSRIHTQKKPKKKNLRSRDWLRIIRRSELLDSRNSTAQRPGRYVCQSVCHT